MATVTTLPLPDEAATKLMRRLERQLESRPLEPWERYRALVDVVDDYREQLDSSDKKTRFALIIMGLLNAVNFLLVVRSDMFGPGATGIGRWLAVYMAIYAFLSLYFFSQAIEALRPRGAKFHVHPGALPPGAARERRLRSVAQVALAHPEDHYAFWREAPIGQLSKEVAFQAQALARINVEKFQALERVYRGLVGLTALTAVLVTALAFRGLTT